MAEISDDGGAARVSGLVVGPGEYIRIEPTAGDQPQHFHADWTEVDVGTSSQTCDEAPAGMTEILEKQAQAREALRAAILAHRNNPTYHSLPQGATYYPNYLTALNDALATINARMACLIDLLGLPEDEVPLIRAVLLGDNVSRGPLADLIEDKGQHARAERVRNPQGEVK